MTNKKNLAIYRGKKLFQQDISYTWPIINEEVKKAVIKQLNTALSIYKRDGVVAQFEDIFAKFHKVKYALITNSGTSALHSAFYAIGLKPNDEVICPDYTFFATALPLFQLGVLPVLADCDECGRIDPIEIEKLINNRTKAVVVTHMWGLPCQMDKISKLCKKYKLSLIEDCSHAHGAKYKGKYVGTFGDAGAWSMQTQKIVAAGEGGVMVTNNRRFYDWAQLLGHFNKRSMQEISPRAPYYGYAETGTGFKYRAHPIGVAIALTQITKLKKWIKGKNINAKRIRKIIKKYSGLTPLHPEIKEVINAYYAFVFLVNKEKCGYNAKELAKIINAEGFTDLDVPKATSPLHTFKLFQKPISPVIKYKKSCIHSKFPNAKFIAANSLKISVPVEYEKGSRGDKFIKSFDKVLSKVLIK